MPIEQIEITNQVETKNGKPWWQSKTVWANILLIVITILSNSIIPGFPIAWATAIVAICNIILRFISDTPINAPLITKRGINS